MLFRSHLRTGRSIIGLARSPDGFHFTADPQPFLTPARDGPFAAYEEFGVEDPRVTLLDGEYLITYSAYSRNGVRIALAKTKDFSKWKGLAHHRGGLSECSDLSRKVRRPLCPAGPSPFGNRALVHLDFLFSGSAFLGRVAAHHAARTLSLGRNEDRSGRAADQDGPGMAFHLSRRFPDDGRIGLSLGRRSSRSAWTRRRSSAWATRGFCSRKIPGKSPDMSTTWCSPAARCGADGTVKIYWGGADTVMCVGEANISDLVANSFAVDSRAVFGACVSSSATGNRQGVRYWPDGARLDGRYKKHFLVPDSPTLVIVRLGKLSKLCFPTREGVSTAILTTGAVTFFSSFRSSDLSQSI
jgi:beta-1,2-mannobiose phosphorylase / 1,2-beta-oligomannan phosphorylase